MKAYFDSSAIVKLGRPEQESMALIDYLDDRQPSAVTSILADVEVRRALERLRARGADPGDHLRGFFLIDLSRDVKDVTYWRGRTLRLWVDEPQEFQLDGDEFGEAVQVIARVDPGALAVRVAHS